MESLPQLLQRMQATFSAREATSPTPQLGSTSVAGKSITPRPMTRLAQTRMPGQPMDAAEAQRIAAQLRSNSLWQTAPTAETQRLQQHLLTESLTPATYDEAAYWLARFCQHFSTRNAEREGVIISDVAAELSARHTPIGAIINGLHDLMLAATRGNPWMPPSGQIIATVTAKAKTYAAMQKRTQGGNPVKNGG